MPSLGQSEESYWSSHRHNYVFNKNELFNDEQRVSEHVLEKPRNDSSLGIYILL